MKKILFLIIFVLPAVILFGQRNANVGIASGAASYMGDINPQKLFYSPSIYYGAIYRYNIDKRFALRINGYYTNLNGSSEDFPSHNNYQLINEEFSSSFLDLASQIEFNFYPYMPNEKQFTGSFYISGGLGYSIVLSGDSYNAFNILFGIGYKLTLTRRISGGLEYNFRRSFSDRIDNFPLESQNQNILLNNDWYNYLGVFITYKFINFAVDCPTYN